MVFRADPWYLADLSPDFRNGQCASDGILIIKSQCQSIIQMVRNINQVEVMSFVVWCYVIVILVGYLENDGKFKIISFNFPVTHHI